MEKAFADHKRQTTSNCQGDFNFLDRQAAVEFIMQVISHIDRQVNCQLDSILRAQPLQQLEASWRSVEFLVKKIPHVTSVKIKLLNLSKTALAKDLHHAIEFDQSQIFQKVYSEEFGMPGGEPYGVLIGDYQFHNTVQDRAILQGMSQVAAAAFSPFIASAAPQLLGLSSFKQLGSLPDINAIFKRIELQPWRQMCVQDDMRFIGLVLPSQLLRIGFARKADRNYGFCLELAEERHYLWGNASYAFAMVLVHAFSEYGWLGNIRGYTDSLQTAGQALSPLSSSSQKKRNMQVRLLTTQCMVSDTQEAELSRHGLIPLCHSHYADKAIFYSNSSLQQAKKYDKEIASENAAISAMLQYILCASRFAHYIKIIGRDLIGAYQDPVLCQSLLNQWLLQYTAANSNLSLQKRAQYPLQAAEVTVNEYITRPGSFICRMYLKPCFQLEQLDTTVTFVTEIVQKV